jgi:hypothetical protein
MSESDVRQAMRFMARTELEMLLATYILQEQGIEVTEQKQIDEVIEQNYIREVAREDLVVEIINSRQRLGI